MQLPFYKAHATGNDFVVVENWDQSLRLDAEVIRGLCERRYGIGADGLIVLQPRPPLDYEMVYYNADGALGSMCGNGGRAAFALMQQLGRVGDEASFVASDGTHRVSRLADGCIRLEMHATHHVDRVSGEGLAEAWYVNTGSPHHVLWVADVNNVDVPNLGPAIRHHAHYQPGGTNVNFAQRLGDHRLAVRTFERGVEAETLSCGTGVTAVALVAAHLDANAGAFAYSLLTPGGQLSVERDAAGHLFLIGPAAVTYHGVIDTETLRRD